MSARRLSSKWARSSKWAGCLVHDALPPSRTTIAAELTGREPVHGLVNNAGITRRARIAALRRADGDRVLAIIQSV